MIVMAMQVKMIGNSCDTTVRIPVWFRCLRTIVSFRVPGMSFPSIILDVCLHILNFMKLIHAEFHLFIFRYSLYSVGVSLYISSKYVKKVDITL